MNYVIDVLIILGILFAIAGVLGLIRMPDAFCRMQASTIISTLVVILVIIGAIIYCAVYLKNTEMIIKLAVLGLFYIITSPISGHAIAKGAYRHGVKMTGNNKCDMYGEDMEND
ncbi:MAG: monovalent cation/H(+) antiporter subunit G [Lachnospiraceae bacterium]|jgi:multicomponent Na+:H+ antiporter subunit G